MNLPARSNQPDGDSPPVALSTRAYAVQRASPAALGDSRPIFQDEAPVFVLANLRVAAGFPFRAFQRHKKLAIWTFAGLMAAVLAAIVVTPKHYLIETRFSAEKNFLMPALGNPKRAVPTESDSPTRLASEAVMKRTNLMEIVRQTKLMSAPGTKCGRLLGQGQGRCRDPAEGSDHRSRQAGSRARHARAPHVGLLERRARSRLASTGRIRRSDTVSCRPRSRTSSSSATPRKCR